MADTADEETGAEPEAELVLDAGSFTASERMECQTRFDVPFGDLMRYTIAAVDSRRTTQLALLENRAGEPVWPDQVLQHMVWIQAKRANPDAQLEDFDGLTIGELASARVRGAVGKGRTSTRSSRSSPGPASAGSSTA